MALPISGSISFQDLKTEFTGTNPVRINSYYAGGARVPHTVTGFHSPIPSSGQIDLASFRGSAGSILSGARWKSFPTTYGYLNDFSVNSEFAGFGGGGFKYESSGGGLIWTRSTVNQLSSSESIRGIGYINGTWYGYSTYSYSMMNYTVYQIRGVTSNNGTDWTYNPFFPDTGSYYDYDIMDIGDTEKRYKFSAITKGTLYGLPVYTFNLYEETTTRTSIGYPSGYVCRTYFSTDGVSWTSAPSSTVRFDNAPSITYIPGVGADPMQGTDGTFLYSVVTTVNSVAECRIYTSKNLTSWTIAKVFDASGNQLTNADVAIVAVPGSIPIKAGNKIIFMTNGKTLSSTDGITFTLSLLGAVPTSQNYVVGIGPDYSLVFSKSAGGIWQLHTTTDFSSFTQIPAYELGTYPIGSLYYRSSTWVGFGSSMMAAPA